VSDRRKYLILIGAIAAALVGAIMLAVPGSPVYQKPTLGLDLQGGLEVILKAVPPKGHKLTPEDLDRSITIMQRRINKLGVSEPEIRKQGTDQIVIQLAGVHDPAAAAKLIGTTAQLLFFDFEPDLVGPSTGPNNTPVATPSLYDLLKQVQPPAGSAAPEAYYLFKNNTVTKKPAKKGGKPTTITTHSIKGTAPTRAELLKPFNGRVPAGYEVLTVPAHRLVVSCAAATGCLGASAASKNGTYYYLFKYFPNNSEGPPELTGKDLDSGGIRADIDPSSGQWTTLLSFTGHGSKMFQKITKAEYERGKIASGLAGAGGDRNSVQQYAGHSAIVLDNQLQSTPYIDYTDAQLQNGIAGGAQITTGSQSEAKNLALILQTGALPVSFKQIERTEVSATLGKESLTQAWHAAAVGLIAVAIFLLVLYRFLGLVAVFGLAIYALLYYAAIQLFNVTLTLPGFAGLILTIGVAADANVVVFERIKEEVRGGRSVRAAVATGYQKGFHTILDANVVTAITALVLFLIAVASVKGFALMLLLGTLISLLTAVAATRAILALLGGFKWFSNPRFMGVKGESIPRWAKIDVASRKRRRLLLSIATAAIIASVLVIAVKGLNFGIDFKGGTQMSFRTATPTNVGAVQDILAKNGLQDAVVQGRGARTADAYKQFQIRARHLTNAKQAEVVDELRARGGLTGQPNVQTVSSSFSSQIARDAIVAIIVSFALIAVYIALRFQWRFAIPILRTLFNDILVTIGVYALSGREVTVSTVAAVLTVLGYSIYDTIIVFDRVRENIPLMPKSTFAQIANLSIAETLRRSVATTFITLMPIVSLFVFGGQTLQDFAFALMIGIGLGAVSTIFVATPFLTVLMERSPEFRRRVGSETIDESVIARALRRGRGTGRAREAGAPEPVEGTPEPVAGVAEPVDGRPEPEFADVAPPVRPSDATAQARRDKRRQRRKTRPHGRAR
jgi:SecD/SecF fusion protein